MAAPKKEAKAGAGDDRQGVVLFYTFLHPELHLFVAIGLRANAI